MENWKVISTFLLLIILFFSCEKNITTSPEYKGQDLSFVSIKSSPSGARIFVDDRDEGIFTPDSLSWLDPIEHKITLKLKNYRDTSFYVITKQDSNVYLNIDYLKNPKMLGKIFVKTNADSTRIFVNGKLWDKFAPDTISNVVPGNYSIRVTADGFREDSLVVKVTSNITADARFFLRDTTYWVDYSTSLSGIPDDYINAIEIDKNKVVWIGTNGSGLVSFDGKQWVTYDGTNSLIPGNNIKDLKVDNNNVLWIATTKGAAILKDGVWEVFTTKTTPQLKSDYCFCIEFNYDYSIAWLGTSKGLYYKSGQGYWHQMDFGKQDPVSNNWISGLVYDINRHLWIATKGNGVVRYAWDGSYTLYKKGHSGNPNWRKVPFPNDNIITIGVAGRKILVGHDLGIYGVEGGLSVYVPIPDYWVIDIPGLPSKLINAIKTDKNKRTWICTSAGIVTYNEDDYDNRIVLAGGAHKLKVTNVMDITFDEDNDVVWVATFGGGIYKFKKNFK